MCDYSLHAHKNRLANEGETLVTVRFPGGSMGMVSSGDPAFRDVVEQGNNHSAHMLCAVCIPPGAQLMLEDIPVRLRKEFAVRETELVTFTQLGVDAYIHRDGVRFDNGRELLLQRLNENQCVRVLSLAGASERVELSMPPAVQVAQRASVLARLMVWMCGVGTRFSAQAGPRLPVVTPPHATVPENRELVGR
ncbi:MAG: hypothetical protein JNN11_01690 [Candidatus Doudnabacteria bacterium]|nr:hypothetical protein [Candidatus Doudnabacteria bacterium]